MDSGLNHIVLAHNAKRALSRGRFFLTYQPIYSVGTREVDSVETLLRWRMSDGQLAAAEQFSSIFRDPVLSRAICDFVIDNTVRQASLWDYEGHEYGRLAINTTVHDLISGALPWRLMDRLDLYAVTPERIEIEVPAAALDQPQASAVEATVLQLHRMGFAVTMDNFMPSQQNLEPLRRLPFQRVKIHRAVLRDTLAGPVQRQTMRDLVDLCHDRNMAITASGVEDEHQMETALELGFDSIQGYFVCLPKEAELVPRVCQVMNLQGRTG
ncbi:EAL domain-containing protein [Peteryoungia desertarenae]|uniref:EAL domain-containing protein n=1 Tax=Peteryoungia desertarenae TaxID=1813451 RepID=A0ABX6QMT3_9HYPH|nr:EAL domain-containing protein [Peteryoungia desertarenae]QLF69777.1 EAL domain-containing protein [Peteryoungia desertarenae]